MPNQSLDNRVVIITGGARGIGYATARRLISMGAKVAIGDIDHTRLLEAADELGIEVSGHLDVTDSESFRAFYAMVAEKLGPPDVLINNAGIMPVGPTLDESDDVARRILEINVLGVILGTKIALGSMLPRRSGHIINIASMAGEAFLPGLATYGASKAAVIGFTESVRLEHRSSGVNVSMVLPTFTNTDLVAGATGPKGFRNAEPEEIADAVAGLLVKPKSRRYVTKLMGAAVIAQRGLPRAFSERLTRTLGGEEMFLGNVNSAERNSYEARARKS